MFTKLCLAAGQLFHVAAAVTPWPPKETTPSRARLPGLKLYIKLSCLAIGLLLLCACTTTKVFNEWRSTDGTDTRFNHLMVVALFKQDQPRHMLEDEFAWQISNQGQMVTRSYNLVPSLNANTTDRLTTIAKAVGADGVLVIRMISIKQHIKTEPANSPPASINLSAFLQQSWKDNYDLPDLMTNTAVIAESRLFDAKSGKLVWSLATQSKNQFGSKWETFFLAKRVLGKLKDAMQP